ncbi:helix-turn-helix transcriptional regulator [Ideonella sp. 4Y11]|uniref:Helix-turn-helix transcriptional regulator n=1 Tax=Ideonella aquatica TaxID=2824119 RepID=A0A941BMF3_9BURK|nr:helix-turn-helix transcriptional regulator [Ideonella aquatica]MBQ0960779.1 helix-turn-helix transcriptional regulator [Ideonella aquatica]
MKNTSKVSQIRALASAGLPPEGFIAAVLEALHGVIPSYRNLFDWTEPDGRLVRYFFEGPIDHEVAKHYFEEFHNQRELEVMPAFRDTITGRASVKTAEQLDQPAFYESALYNEIWRPQRLKTRIETIVRTSSGTPLGSLVLYRGPGDRRFTAADERLLERIAPYIARGLSAPTPTVGAPAYIASPAGLAFVCLGTQGQVTQLSANAHRLLLLAHGDVTPERAAAAPAAESFPVLATLCRQWLAQRDAFQTCSLQVQNAWGQFVFDGCGLKGTQPDGGAQLHVTISHREPNIVAARRAVASFDLTHAQQEVCLLLHAGRTQTEAAEQLGVSVATVVDHVRKIYAKLDVHSVIELVGLINARQSRSGMAGN